MSTVRSKVKNKHTLKPRNYLDLPLRETAQSVYGALEQEPNEALL